MGMYGYVCMGRVKVGEQGRGGEGGGRTAPELGGGGGGAAELGNGDVGVKGPPALPCAVGGRRCT